MTYNEKHTELRTKIDKIKAELKTYQDMRYIILRNCERLEEDLDKIDIELLTLGDDEDIDILQKKADASHREYIQEKEKNYEELELKLSKARMEYDYVHNIDMSGATDNGDR